jgi:hypothetical protein
MTSKYGRIVLVLIELEILIELSRQVNTRTKERLRSLGHIKQQVIIATFLNSIFKALIPNI